MKLNKNFLILLAILIALCMILYFIQSVAMREGLSSDTNEGAVKEAKGFQSDPNYAADSGYIKILPLQSTVLNTSSTDGLMKSYPDLTNLPINHYVVKSSYNSACSGFSNNISNEMLMYTLSRGCRFVDFEISNIAGVPYVVSPNYNGPVKIDKTKICKLNDILKTTVTYGLTDSTGRAPNYKDPLFIHLRINSDPSYNNLYEDVAKAIQTSVKDVLYSGKVVINKTKMKDIMGKAVLILDTNYDPDWKKKSGSLSQMIHLESGNSIVTVSSPSLIKQQCSTPINKGSDGLSVSNDTIQIILPETDIGLINTDKGKASSNPDFENIVTKWACNFITNRFYIRDDAIIRYERFFNINKLAIVPLSNAYNHYLSQQ
jgi:hypothetical protein